MAEIGGKCLVYADFIHDFWIPFQNKVRMRINLLGVAREYADEAKNQAEEKRQLSNHAKQLLKQAKELATNTELLARVSRESKSILRGVAARKQKIEKGRAVE